MSIITSIVFLFVLLNILSVLDGKEKISRKASKKIPIKKVREATNTNKSKKTKFPEDWDI